MLRGQAGGVRRTAEGVHEEGETPTLVAAMHAIAETYRDFPTVLINGAPDPAVPEPDTHGDDVQPLIQEVCRLAGASGATLPPACA